MRTSAVAPCCCEPTHAMRPSALSAPLCGLRDGHAADDLVGRGVDEQRPDSLPQAETRTREPSAAMARPCGFAPTSTERTTRSVAVSITLTVESPSLDT